MDPTSPMTISNLLVHIPSRVASIDASMLPLTGDLRSGARADLRIQGTPHLLHLRMCTHASSCTPQCHLHPHHHLTLRHTSAPQLTHRCPRTYQHSVDRNEQVFKPTGPHCLSCLSSSRGVWACTTSTSGEISHIHASCSSTRPMKRRPKRTDKAELMAECQRQVQFGCWPAGRCCHRPRLPPTSPAAAAAKAHCTAGQGTRPRCLCRWALYMAARAGACSWLAIGLASLQGEHRARGRGARPHPPAARPSSSNSPAQPRHSQCQQLQQAEGQRTHRTHQTQPSRTNHSQREHTTKPVRLIKMSCL